MSKKFEDLEFQHIAYNAQRTLRNADSSQFEIIKFHNLDLLKDQKVAFANQIWGLNEQSIVHLPNALTKYNEISMSPYLEITHDNMTENLKTSLVDLGFESVETLNFLTVNLADIKTAAPKKITVERLQSQDADMFLNLLKTSGMKPAAEVWQLKKHLYCTDIFRCFVAKVDGHPRALATTFVDQQYGLLANAYTQSNFQNQGCQTALLQARMNDAKQLGLTELIVDVVPNTSSERNCLKVGFKPLNTRHTWHKKSPT